MACKNKMDDLVLKLLEKQDLDLSLQDEYSNNALMLTCINKNRI